MALTDNLVAYWKLDETSGTRYDETANNNDLTDTNTVGYGTGIISNGADFIGANAEKLNLTTLAGDSGGDFSVSFWFKADLLHDAHGVSVANGGGSANGWQIQFDENSGGGRCFVRFYNASVQASQWYANTSIYSTGSLDHWVFTFDVSAAGSALKCYKNGSDITSSFNNEAASASSRSAYSSTFAIGQTVDANNLDGIVDEYGIWNRVLTSDEVTSLYNSGSGLTYPFTAASGPATLKTWDTVATANVKTINGVAIASVKTINTAA